MNSLKTLFIVAVLGAVAYGVYVSINRNPETPEEPDIAPAWPEAPQVRIPGPGAAAPQFRPAGSAAEMAAPFSSRPTGPAGAGAAADASIPPTPPISHPPLATSPPPGGILTHGASSPYGPSGDTGRSANVPSANDPAAAGNLQTLPGQTDNLGLPPNPVRRTPEAAVESPIRRSPEQPTSDKFAAFLQTVKSQLDKGHLAEAHLVLSPLYDNPNVPPEQAQQVTDLLDQLAGTVVYSRRHLLAQPYRVRPGDTLEQIAETYNVPPQLLARINGIRDPQRLEPGQELKVVPGPFSALIDLVKYELTLMVEGRYAGRFPIGVGLDAANVEGSYLVRDKIVNPTYHRFRRSSGPEEISNSLGKFWIDLGDQIGIHGTNDPQNLHRTGGSGSIRLGDQDIQDIYGILSIGSRVIIRR